jgi:hypothetical protein
MSMVDLTNTSGNTSIEKEQAFKSGLRCLRRALRDTFDQMSINHYVRVFGAAPDRAPRRQWLYLGKEGYIHIADVWNNPNDRKRVKTRLCRNPRTWRLYEGLCSDLSYLCEFAGQQCATDDLGPAVAALRGWLGISERHARVLAERKGIALIAGEFAADMVRTRFG